ncbi:hypothetical protein ACLUXI_02105 [Bifidobacterium apri]|uniref:hypothetical protein n=1 Tax=Bifidobacterium apri TaxID=1769423 RepID=UPI00399200E2
MSEVNNSDQDKVETVAMQQVDAAERPADTAVMPQTASTAEPDVATTAEAAPGSTAAPRTDIPLDELARQRQTAGEEPQQSHPLGGNTVPIYTGAPADPAALAPSTAAVIRTPAPSGVNAGTVVLGVLLVVLGVAAIVMAGMVPNWPFGQVDPWVVAAVSIGVAGVALVVIAIVWAIINATASARRDRDKSADAVH